MKLTKSKLKQIIKEELQNILLEKPPAIYTAPDLPAPEPVKLPRVRFPKVPCPNSNFLLNRWFCDAPEPSPSLVQRAAQAHKDYEKCMQDSNCSDKQKNRLLRAVISYAKQALSASPTVHSRYPKAASPPYGNPALGSEVAPDP